MTGLSHEPVARRGTLGQVPRMAAQVADEPLLSTRCCHTATGLKVLSNRLTSVFCYLFGRGIVRARQDNVSGASGGL